jgi:hypothetical protein
MSKKQIEGVPIDGDGHINFKDNHEQAHLWGDEAFRKLFQGFPSGEKEAIIKYELGVGLGGFVKYLKALEENPSTDKDHIYEDQITNLNRGTSHWKISEPIKVYKKNSGISFGVTDEFYNENSTTIKDEVFEKLVDKITANPTIFNPTYLRVDLTTE